MAAPPLNGLLTSSSGLLVARGEASPAVNGGDLLGGLDNSLAVGLLVAIALLFYWWHRIL